MNFDLNLGYDVAYKLQEHGGERGEAAALSLDSDSWSSPDRGVSLHR